MTATVQEVNPSRPVDGETGRQLTTRQFQVYDTSSAVTSPQTVINLFGTATSPTALPKVDDPFPDIPSLIATRYRVEMEPDSVSIWRVTWFYETVPPGGVNPEQVGYVEYTLNQGREFSEAWRKNPSNIPADGVPVIGPTGYPDIGGEHIDSGGEPGTALRLQQILEISEVMAGQPTFNAYAAAVGKRNSSSFQGAAKGLIVMLPVTSARIARNKFRVTFRFAWDQYYHMVQRPARDVNGIILKVGGTGATATTAESVYWFQPFDDFFDFNNLSANW